MKPLPRIISPEVADLRRRVAALELHVGSLTEQVAALVAIIQADPKQPTQAAAKASVREILADVSARHGIPVEVILGRERTKPVAIARQEAMALARAGGRSLEQIARVFQRDHTTVMSNVRQHESRQSGG